MSIWERSNDDNEDTVLEVERINESTYHVPSRVYLGNAGPLMAVLFSLIATAAFVAEVGN